jgi:hypothetical protein
MKEDGAAIMPPQRGEGGDGGSCAEKAVRCKGGTRKGVRSDASVWIVSCTVHDTHMRVLSRVSEREGPRPGR